MILLIDGDAGNLGRAQGTGDKQLYVARVVDHVDILITQLTNDTMHTTTLHTYAGTYRIDTLVVALYSYLGTIAWHTGHTTDGNQTIVDLRHLSLEQTLQEHGRGTRKDNTGIVVLVLHLLDDGTNGLALVIVVVGNLLTLRQMELVTLIVDQQHLTLPNLVNLATDHLTHTVLVLLIQRIVLQLENLRSQCLTEVQNGTTTKLLEVHLLGHFLTHLIVGFNLLRLAQGDFLVLILHLAVCYYNTVTVNLEVSLVGVDDYVKVFIRSIDLCDNIAEAFFQHTHQSRTVNVLCLFKFLKGLNH